MRIQRYSDVIEKISEKAFYFFVGAVFSGAFGALLLRYRGDGMFLGLAWVLILAAIGMLAYGLFVAFTTTKVTSFSIECPICTEVNELTEKPEDDDITCVACNHRIPIRDGQVLPVMQVRCGFCNSLNYYSDKTDLLICETCNHEIPIHQEEGKPVKHLPKGFAVVDDNMLYELVLLDAGKGGEDVVKTLQSMLALNRNQVKDLLEEVPVTLLQGITRMKADMLTAQLTVHGAKAEARQIDQ
ncbi:MAG: ribosomal protein L7/L12 [Armatimonadetes bacterium]|nr:hypothetical protein [Armatimonadota bacterium]MBS1702162.1 ribosomal protein L7/L12 [Armatimonadota bacterium]MBS1725755.1 ribosomal protein L7/L12 [Armatimonadota bacterium]